MSWPIGGAAAVMMAALLMGCTQPPARQGAGASRAPLRVPTHTQSAKLPKPQAAPMQLAGASAVSDYDQNRWRDIPIPEARPAATSTRPTPRTAPRIVRASALASGAALAPGVAAPGVRYAPPRMVPRPAGVLSITQVGLDPIVTMRDPTTDSVDALERRLTQGPRQQSVSVPLVRGLLNPADSLTAVIGGKGHSINGGFGGVVFLPPVRFSWSAGSPLASGELGLDR